MMKLAMVYEIQLLVRSRHYWGEKHKVLFLSISPDVGRSKMWWTKDVISRLAPVFAQEVYDRRELMRVGIL